MLLCLQPSITFVHRIEHSTDEEQTENQTGSYLSLIIEDLVAPTLLSAHVNQYLHTGDELRAREHKQRRNRHQRRDQEQRTVDSISRHHRQQPRKDRRESKDQEEERFVT